MKKVVLIHYHEINLKRNNRGWFEKHLHRNVAEILKGLCHEGIRRHGGRMFVRISSGSDPAEIEKRLRRVFGIANFAFAQEVPSDMNIIGGVLKDLVGQKEFNSFKIATRRGIKSFPLNSPQVNAQLGEQIKELTGAKVQLDNPDLTCFVEIVGQHSYLYFDKIPGGGGLPTGTGGKVLCLLSGGIDSPVAAYRVMRRGCRVCFIHFHSFPHTTLESQEKVRRILKVLSRFQLDSTLFLIPFSDLQREIVAYAPPALRVVLYRRFMIRIAEAVASREGISALVTGDSLGQVASQTLENLRAVSATSKMMIFRPLIGDDKEDIIRIAREIGTYNISILPDQDCCTIFVPRHPETMARIAQVEQAERPLNIPALVSAAAEAASSERIAADYSQSPEGAT